MADGFRASRTNDAVARHGTFELSSSASPSTNEDTDEDTIHGSERREGPKSAGAHAQRGHERPWRICNLGRILHVQWIFESACRGPLRVGGARLAHITPIYLRLTSEGRERS